MIALSTEIQRYVAFAEQYKYVKIEKIEIQILIVHRNSNASN